jgi:hypothetical protein
MTDSASQGSLPKPTLATRLPGVALAVLIVAVAYVARLVLWYAAAVCAG